MSPFSHFLHELRLRLEIRQADLAKLVGCEQSYISALEVGIKGPPTQEFITRLIQVLALSPVEQQQLHNAIAGSERKLIIDADTPEDRYWLLKDLRDQFESLSPVQIRMMRDLLSMKAAIKEELPDPVRRLKRRRKEEATM
ncbi:MAG: helix-turn-helix domain-containing protein [Glaciimonas sp.]|nr:helix-turn-helix domain-containing protein [Glaciimonas sp.]